MSSKIFADLQEDIKTAMKERQAEKLMALRTLLAQIKDATINAGREPTDADVAAVVAKALKQRQDSIEQYRQGGRADLVQKEENEVAAIKKYQPQQMDQAAIEELVRKCISETGAAGKKDMGKLMQALMPLVKGRADGKLVNQIVSALLGPG